MRVLVIGAGGLIGGALTRLLATGAPHADSLLLADRAPVMPPNWQISDTPLGLTLAKTHCCAADNGRCPVLRGYSLPR